MVRQSAQTHCDSGYWPAIEKRINFLSVYLFYLFLTLFFYHPIFFSLLFVLFKKFSLSLFLSLLQKLFKSDRLPAVFPTLIGPEGTVSGWGGGRRWSQQETGVCPCALGWLLERWHGGVTFIYRELQNKIFVFHNL